MDQSMKQHCTFGVLIQRFGMPIQKPKLKIFTFFSHVFYETNFRMKSLLDLKIRCLILTSSTLTPFESFIAELDVRFPIQFISEHVIEKHQKFAKIMTHGDGNVLFDSVYNNR